MRHQRADVAHQDPQDRELGDVQLDRRAGDLDLVGRAVEADVTDAQDVADEDRRGDDGVAELDADAGDEHLDRDRLDDVVVGADAEGGDDPRRRRRRADTMMMGTAGPHVELPAQLDAVDVGQAEVEEDEVVVAASRPPPGACRPSPTGVTSKPRAVSAISMHRRCGASSSTTRMLDTGGIYRGRRLVAAADATPIGAARLVHTPFI